MFRVNTCCFCSCCIIPLVPVCLWIAGVNSPFWPNLYLLCFSGGVRFGKLKTYLCIYQVHSMKPSSLYKSPFSVCVINVYSISMKAMYICKHWLVIIVSSCYHASFSVQTRKQILVLWNTPIFQSSTRQLYLPRYQSSIRLCLLLFMHTEFSLWHSD